MTKSDSAECSEKSSSGKKSCCKGQQGSSSSEKCKSHSSKLENKKEGRCSDESALGKRCDCKGQKESSSGVCGDSSSQPKSESKKGDRCGDESAFGKDTMRKGQDSGSTGKCGCGSSTSQSKTEGSCPDKSSFGKNEDCPAPKKTTKTCHSSQKKFRNDADKCADEKLKKDEEKCHSSRKRFLKSSEDKGSGECAKTNPSENKCEESKKVKESDCLSSRQHEETKGSCSSSKAVGGSKEKACSSSGIKEGSTYSKIGKFCKDLAKEYVRPKSESKCSSAEETIPKNRLPITKPPCHPEAEKRMDISDKPTCNSKVTCSAKVTCLQPKTPQISDFFPLDARNKKLNECIEKYMKIDPDQVIKRCSGFANKTPDLSEKFARGKSQKKCVGTMPTKASGAVKTSLLGPRHVQLARRWAPTAGIYLATTAIFSVYVTEWKAILKYVPGYAGIAKEATTST